MYSSGGVEFSLLGGFFAFLAALCWACYSLTMRTVSAMGYPEVQTTRRFFLYSIIMLLPFALFSGEKLDMSLFVSPIPLANLLFLAIGASAMGFVIWNGAITCLGAVESSVYIYLIPIVTCIGSYFALHEVLTRTSVLGIAMVLVGLCLSDSGIRSSLFSYIPFSRRAGKGEGKGKDRTT